MNNIHSVHRTGIKCFINPILRKIQHRTDTPYVIASLFDGKGEFVTYVFERVQYYKNAEPPADIEIVEIKVDEPLLKTIKHLLRKN